MNEQLAFYRISNQLINLGWQIEGEGRNVYLGGECRTNNEKRSLGGKRPDFILYGKCSSIPIAVIEAKKPYRKLDNALQQGLDYANKIRAEFVFASDGYIVKAINKNRKPLMLNGEILNEFISEPLLNKFIPNYSLNTETKILKDRNYLVTLFNHSNNLLRKDGIDAGIDSIFEFCCILFVKIKSELEDLGIYSWKNLIKYKDKELYDYYLKIIKYCREKYKGVFREIKIRTPEVLGEIINRLKDLNISKTDMDLKGDAYEHFLKRYSSGNRSVLGQYFTPRHIVEMMCNLLDPTIGKKIYDPFCGTGGMLVQCYKYIRKNIIKKDEIELLKKETLYGNDIAYGASQLAKMNMILIGDGNANISRKDSLSSPVSNKFDYVITNIPFNLPPFDNSSLYDTDEKNSNNICIRHCIKSIKVGGSACIVIPENICYDSQHRKLRKFIVDNCRIKAVIRLPRETFRTYTTARTCILWLDKIKQEKTYHINYIDVQHDGYSSGAWREPIPLKSKIPYVLENKDNISEISQKIEIKENYNFIADSNSFLYNKDKAKFWTLEDLLMIKTEKTSLMSDKLYNEPRLNAETNTVSKKGQGRLGKNIKSPSKIIAEPGDLIIGTLHTQSKNGLFAFSDGYYITTSQIVGKVREKIVDKEYLKICLRNILPKLKKDDLVGRETYTKKEILNINIPKQPKNFMQDIQRIQQFKKEILNLEKEIDSIQNKYT